MSEGGGALRELLAYFDIEVDTSKLKKGEEEVESFRETIETVTRAVKGWLGYEVFEKTKEFIEGTVKAGAQLKIMSERLGTSTDELQAMHLAAGEAGVGAGELDTALRLLNRNLGGAGHLAGQTTAMFQRYGIAVKDAHGQTRPAADVLGDLADVIAKMPDDAQKTAVAMTVLGRGGAALIPLLNKGHEAFDEARKSMVELGGGMSTEFVEAAHKAEAAGVRLEFAWTGLKSRMVQAILPGFEEIVRKLTDIWGALNEFDKKSHVFEDAFSGAKLAIAVVGIWKIIAAVQALTRAQVAAFLTNPITLWVGGLLFALAVYNDLKTALEGGDSVFGDLFGQTGIEKLNEGLKATKATLDVIYTSFKTLYDIVVSGVDTIAGTFKWLGSKLGISKDDGSELFKQGKEHADKAFGSNWTDMGKRLDTPDDRPVGRKKREADIVAWSEGMLAPKITKQNAGMFAKEWADRIGPKEGKAGDADIHGGAFAKAMAQNRQRAANFVRDTAPSVPAAPGQLGGSAFGSAIHQTNTIKIENHLPAGANAADFGKATAEGVTSANERSLYNTKLAMGKT